MQILFQELTSIYSVFKRFYGLSPEFCSEANNLIVVLDEQIRLHENNGLGLLTLPYERCYTLCAHCMHWD